MGIGGTAGLAGDPGGGGGQSGRPVPDATCCVSWVEWSGAGRGQVTDTLSPDLYPVNPELGEGSPGEQSAAWDLVRGLVASRLG